jgi:hypothetical protein
MAMRFTEHPQQAVIRRQTARNFIPRANLTSITADGPLAVKTLVRQPCAAPARVLIFHIVEAYSPEKRKAASKTLTKFLQAGKPRRKFFVSILEAPTERI